MTSISDARAEVQRHVAAVIQIVDRGDATRVAAVEGPLWSALLALGRALMVLFFARQSARLRPTRYEHEGKSYEMAGTETVEVGTRFGKVKYAEWIAGVAGQPRAARDRPLARDLGLPGGFTPMVVGTVAHLCAHMAFGAARKLLSSLFGWAPSPRAILRMVDAAGAEARPFLDQAPVPDGDGEVLVIQVDGKGAPAISSREYAKRTQPHGKKPLNRRHGRKAKRREKPAARRAPGKKSKNAKMAAVGILYTLRRDEDGKLDGPINKRVYGTFTSYRDLFVWIADEAKRRGYGTPKLSKVLFIADGAEVLWSLQREFFGDAEVCLDWFHVVEKLWEAGKAVCRGTRRKRKELEAWVGSQKARLRNGRVAEVIAELQARLDSTPVTGPGNKYRREVLSRIANHLAANLHRLDYQRLRKQDLDIGSGAVEGAVRHLVGARLDASGMRWSKGRAEAVLHLRCILLNGLWAPFEEYLMRKEDFRLAAQPIPTETHDAVVKKAA